VEVDFMPVAETAGPWPISLHFRLNCQHTNFSFLNFYRAMLRRKRYCYGMWSVCTSARLSVRDVEVSWSLSH